MKFSAGDIEIEIAHVKMLETGFLFNKICCSNRIHCKKLVTNQSDLERQVLVHYQGISAEA